jgi:hypothetical protein
MLDKFEGLVREVYRRNKARNPQSSEHPDEEDIANFLDNNLAAYKAENIKAHLLACQPCAELVALSMKAVPEDIINVPEAALSKVREIVKINDGPGLLEVILRLKDNIFEVISSSGDVLVGAELVPAPVLRSRNIINFKDEIVILRKFQDLTVEARITSKLKGYFDITVKVSPKIDQKSVRSLRATLVRGDLELESYISESGLFVFEHILLGDYTLKLDSNKETLASILLEIRE